MRISLEWLKEFIDLDMSPHDIGSRLTMAGLEKESMECIDDDHVLEINVTPNRPDCLSVFGIARELSAITGMPLRKFPEHNIKDEKKSDFKVEIEDEDLCRRYAGRVIKGITIAESPEWLRKRLGRCGLRAVNNIVDITNYVLLEMGHPLHAFDLDTLKGGIIKVGRAHKGQKIVTLDGIERELAEDALLIMDKEQAVAVAGIMGGKDTEVSESTRNIFLESAWFDPCSIRRTSRSLGITSESSYRFERGADIEMLDAALDRAAFLIKTIAGGDIEAKIDVYPKKFLPDEIKVRYEKVNNILGTEISPSEMRALLRRLDLKVGEEGDCLKVTAGSHRLDIQRDSDVIEEIARLAGYDKIPVTLPKASVSSEGNDKKHRLIHQIKETIRMAGFNEAINYSFMNSQYLDILSIPSHDMRQKVVAVKNPLRKEDSLLRTMLVPSLIENFKYNFFRGIKDISIFEVSRVFIASKEDALPYEPLRLGGIFYREKAPSLWKEASEGFYLVKGALETLFKELKLREYSFSHSAEPFLHRGKSADVYLSGQKAGWLGVLSPVVTEHLDVKTKTEIIVFELDIDKLLPLISDVLTFAPIPKFPHIERDIAIIVADDLMAGDIINLIKAYPSEFIEEVSVFDFYKGANIPKGKKSLAYSIRYRSRHRTLTDEEVENIHNGLIKYLIEKTNGEIRGGTDI